MKKVFKLYVISYVNKGIRQYLKSLGCEWTPFLPESYMFTSKDRAEELMNKKLKEDNDYVAFRESVFHDKKARKEMGTYEVIELELKVNK